MARRVIFPDPEIWTRKEPVLNINPHTAGDLRRAAAFIRHRLYRDDDGVNAIIIDAVESGRVGEFIHGLLTTLDAVSKQLHSEAGLRGFDELLVTLASPEQDPEDVVPIQQRRGARLFIAYGREDTDAQNAVIHEDPDVTPTLLGLVGAVALAMPSLSTTIGASIIDRGIRTFSGMEVEDQ